MLVKCPFCDDGVVVTQDPYTEEPVMEQCQFCAYTGFVDDSQIEEYEKSMKAQSELEDDGLPF